MNEMVQRVAEAMRKVPVDPDITKPHADRSYERMAEAAIAAMRAPTEQMVRAAAMRWHSIGDTSAPYLADCGALVWERAIDAALAE